MVWQYAVREAAEEYFTQFLKPTKSGEIEAMTDMENMQIWLCPAEFGFTWQMTDEEEEKKIFMNVIYGIIPEWFYRGISMLVMDEVDWCMQCRTCE